MDFEEGWRVQYLKDEPFCEVPNDEDEVLCAGSDDEHYESPDERRLRYEEAALSYLTGHMPVLLTSVLRGPFEGPDANGWVNPWLSKRDAAQATPAIAGITTLSRTPEVEVRDTDSTTSCHLPSPRSLDQVGITPHPYMEDDELERVHAWRNAAESARKTDDDPTVLLSTEMSQPSAESQSQSQSQKKRRSIGSEWLQRKDNKRRRAEDIAVEDASIVAQPQTQHFLRSQPQSQGTQSQAVAGSGAQSLRSSQSQKLSSQRVSKRSSQTVPTRSSQRLSSKTPAPPASTSEDEVPAPLSTPIQTPQSARRSRVAAKATAKEEHISADEDTDIKLADSEVKVKPEFETQEDESFLFRARPRSRGIEAIPDLSHLQEDSFSLSSSSSFASESEDSAQAEDAALDLDGDTFLADDTKETSPESNEEHKGQVVEVLEKVVSREPKSKGLVLQLAADLAADITMGNVDTTEPVKPVAQQDENDIVDRQCQDEEMNEAVVSASQDVTIVEQAAAQGEEDEEPLKNPEPAILPNDTQDAGPPGNPMEQGETHTDSAAQSAQIPIPQSPWSKSDVLPVDRTRPISEAVDEQESSITAETPAAQHTYHMETPNNCHNNIRTTPTPNTTLPFTPTPVADANEATHQPVGVSFAPSGSRSEPSRPESPAVPASQQSPWKTDTQTMAPVPQMQAIHEESNDSFVGPSQQSPWTVSPEKMRQAAQEVLLSKLFNAHVPATPSPLVSSPAQPYAATPGNPIEALETPLAAKTAAPAIETPMAETPRPTTPEPIFSIKRFAQFMSPSPEKPRRLSNKARLSGGHLPSTQNLLAATTTNPWDSSPRPAKRVRWAPLPHEVEDNDNEDDSGPHTPVAARAASPPPEFAVADLPTGDTDQFQKHFQAVSRKRKIRHHLLPSASQQILESPAPMAMAEAFVAADSFASKAPIAPMAPNGSRTAVESSTQDDTDDVDDVLRNLNEFIDMVDLEADLARAKEEEKREKEALEKRKREASGAIPGFSLDSIMDTGVWR